MAVVMKLSYSLAQPEAYRTTTLRIHEEPVQRKARHTGADRASFFCATSLHRGPFSTKLRVEDFGFPSDLP